MVEGEQVFNFIFPVLVRNLGRARMARLRFVFIAWIPGRRNGFLTGIFSESLFVVHSE